MILEGIVTTIGPDGTVNIAPMGPRVPPDGGSALSRFVLRPFKSARTYANLVAHPEGVLHVTDDVLLLARAVLGPIEHLGEMVVPAAVVRGWVLRDACRYYEFRIVAREPLGEGAQRAELSAEVVHTGRLRDFFGFCRGKHAVVEAAILVTRLHLLPPAEVEAELARLAVLVEKTGGEKEREAFALLRRHAEARRGPAAP